MEIYEAFLECGRKFTPYPAEREAIKAHPADAACIRTHLSRISEGSMFEPRYPLVFVDPNQPRGKIETTSEENAKRLGWNEI